MRLILIALFSGLLFGLGLVTAGMANPAKVIAFLDIFGLWDPSLAFVMMGGIAVTLGGYHFILKRSTPVCAATFSVPNNTAIDGRLIGGSALFGLGWGLVGLCPGPAFTLVAVQPAEASVFIAAMLIGLLVGGPIGARLPASGAMPDQA